MTLYSTRKTRFFVGKRSYYSYQSWTENFYLTWGNVLLDNKIGNVMYSFIISWTRRVWSTEDKTELPHWKPIIWSWGDLQHGKWCTRTAGRERGGVGDFRITKSVTQHKWKETIWHYSTFAEVTLLFQACRENWSRLVNCQGTVQQEPRRFHLSWWNCCFPQMYSTNNDRDLCIHM